MNSNLLSFVTKPYTKSTCLLNSTCMTKFKRPIFFNKKYLPSTMVKQMKETLWLKIYNDTDYVGFVL